MEKLFWISRTETARTSKGVLRFGDAVDPKLVHKNTLKAWQESGKVGEKVTFAPSAQKSDKTKELKAANETLAKENEELKATTETLAKENEELKAANETLAKENEELKKVSAKTGDKK